MSSLLSAESRAEQQAQMVGKSVIALTSAGGKNYLIVKHSRLLIEDRFDFFRLQCVEHSYASGDGQSYLLKERDFALLSNTMEVTVDRKERVAKFGPTGNIVVEGRLRSRGLGSYLMAKVILWATQNYPDFKVDPGDIQPIAGGTLESCVAFYSGRGFDIDAKKRHFSKDRIDQLNSRWYESKVQEISIDELLRERIAISEQVTRLHTSNELLEQREAEELRSRRILRSVLLTGWAACAILIAFPRIAFFLRNLF
jgi:GNAT superfamily N-acetyltransferase